MLKMYKKMIKELLKDDRIDSITASEKDSMIKLILVNDIITIQMSYSDVFSNLLCFLIKEVGVKKIDIK